MPFSVFFCGPRVLSLGELAPALVDELAGRGLASQVLSTVDSKDDGVFLVSPEEIVNKVKVLGAMPAVAILLWPESNRAQREAVLSQIPEAVVVDWCRDDDTQFQFSQRPHCTVHNENEPLEGLAEVFALLEGLAYVDAPQQGQLSPAQDAELVEKLKELGYV